MLNNILEISNRKSKGGRVPIKIALLKIPTILEETNKNGIHWNKEYVSNAIESAKMMPICSEFCDEEKSIPLSHGLTGSFINSDGFEEPAFENSETVGVIESASIETHTINDEEMELLVGTGYVYSQRYPNFVKWLRKNYVLAKVDTSIEIMGLPENENKIIYDGEATEDYRIPKIFQFSGVAILSVSPADDNAVILEISQKMKKKKEDEKHMEFNMEELKSTIKNTLLEMNSHEDQHATEVNNLNTKITELNEQITEKDSVIAQKEEKISELNASLEQMKQALKDLETERDTWWRQRDILESEIAKAEVAKRLKELDSALGEFNEEEKEVVKEDVEKLKENINACQKKEELNNVTSEINSIKSKICMAIVEKQKKEAKIAEQNSQKGTVGLEDIFSEIFEQEITSGAKDINIF